MHRIVHSYVVKPLLRYDPDHMCLSWRKTISREEKEDSERILFVTRSEQVFPRLAVRGAECCRCSAVHGGETNKMNSDRVAALQSIFPRLSPDLLADVLAAHNGDLHAALAVCVEMTNANPTDLPDDFLRPPSYFVCVFRFASTHCLRAEYQC